MRTRAFVLTMSLVAATACHKGGEDKASLPAQAPADNTPPPANATSAEAGRAAGEANTATPATTTPDAAVDAPSNTKTVALRHDSDADKSDATARLIGEVQAARKAELTFRVPGFIQDIRIKAGLTVKKGEVLGSLDARDYQLRYEQAKARHELARISLNKAKRDYDREKQLKADKVSTESSYETVAAAYDQAVVNAKLAELDALNAKRALDDTKLVAPYDSVVAMQLKDEGDHITDATPIFRIYDTAQPEVVLQASERYAGNFKVGDSLTINVPSANFSGNGQITRIVPVIAEQSRTFAVYAKVKGDVKLPTGAYAEGIIK